MKNNLLQEIIISLALIILLVLCLNPFGFWMPNRVLTMINIVLIIVFSVFASFIWRESARDEREVFHRMLAGRIAFLAGAGVLVIGVIVQSFKHDVDFWLVLTLGVMVFSKIIALVYSQAKH